MSKRTLFTYYSISSSTPTPPETNARLPKKHRVEFCASDIISDPGLCRFVNDEGKVPERFLGLKHIDKCTSIALKEALVGMISSHKLSMSMIRGQGYDGASNMRGEFNGVQKLVRDQNPYAFYVHCFAHQLQLVVVAVSTSTPAIADFFNYVPLIVNTVGASCMRKDILLAKHHDSLLEKLENCEIATGRGLNQESSLTRPGDNRWGPILKHCFVFWLCGRLYWRCLRL